MYYTSAPNKKTNNREAHYLLIFFAVDTVIVGYIILYYINRLVVNINMFLLLAV